MNDWPEPSSTVVSARRVVSAGTTKPLSLTEPASLSSLTSGRTRIEMRPSARTIGVNARPTPYCLYSIVVAPSAWLTGIGNSPPARKLAVSPDKAVRFGSARMLTRPSSAAMSSAPARFRPRNLPAAPSVLPPVIALTIPNGELGGESRVLRRRNRPHEYGRLADTDDAHLCLGHRGPQHLVDRRQVLADPDLRAIDDRTVGRGRDDRRFAIVLAEQVNLVRVV